MSSCDVCIRLLASLRRRGACVGPKLRGYLTSVVLSIDLGVRNLALCLLENADLPCAVPKILDWRIEDLLQGTRHKNCKKLSISDLNRLMQTRLSSIRWVRTPTLVAIENQPVGFHARSNTKMKVLSHCIETHFFLRGISAIRFISPKLKFRYSPEEEVKAAAKLKPASKRYRRHKQMACEACSLKISTHWHKLFATHKKKDDLADCYLQGLVALGIP